MQKVGQQEVGQGYWNMCITKEAVIGLQPGVVEGWVMGPMGIVSIVPKMATRGVVAVSATVAPPTVSLSVLKAFPGSHLAAVQISDQNSYWVNSYGNFTEMCCACNNN